MPIRPIRTEADHEATLSEIARLLALDPAPDTADSGRLDILATLVEAYEARHRPIPLPHPAEAIRVRMAETGIGRRALCQAAAISGSRLSEVLNLRRPLSIAMIGNLAPLLDLPIEVLAQPYPTESPQPLRA